MKAVSRKGGFCLRVGVYICHCGMNIEGTLDCGNLARWSSRIENVRVARHITYLCSQEGQSTIERDIKENRLDRIIVAACSPRLHESTFKETLRRAGINPNFLEIANIREQCSWVHEKSPAADSKAFSLIKAAVLSSIHKEETRPSVFPVSRSAIVIGGGVAGMNCALSIANSGIDVYLIERSPTIGGHMVQLDRTFPTLDCAACIITPLMNEVSNHPKISVLTLSELEALQGFKGNFRARVRQKPRYVSVDKCDGCMKCSEVCVLNGRIPDTFNTCLSFRSAIYKPFAQAQPAAAIIDPQSCLMFTKGKCSSPCLDVCLRGAIDFEMRDEVRDIEAGAVIVSTGFEAFDAREIPRYGFGKYPEVINALQFERLLSASGPTGGKIILPDGRKPLAIAFIHCVGSRDEKTYEYCSRTCCMFLMKQAITARERLDARVFEFYLDINAFGKNHQELYRRARQEGVFFIRGRVAEVVRLKGQLTVVAEDTLLGEVVELPVDMVVLGTGLRPSAGAGELAKILKISTDADGFFQEMHPKMHPVETNIDGVFLAGCCQAPRDITDTVAHAEAASAKALEILTSEFIMTEGMVCRVERSICSGCGACVLTCPFQAVYLDDEGGVNVNEAICRGCGICLPACLSGAVSIPESNDEQILAKIEVLSGPEGDSGGEMDS